MHVQIDQSGKIGDTQVATVLSFSNTKHYTILIPATVKRECVALLRTRYRELRQPYLKLFSAALFLLLQEHLPRINLIVIDQEYPGREGEIKGMLLNHVRKAMPEFPKEAIVFGRIGKHSPAHEIAYATYTGQQKPERTISTAELLNLVIKQK